MKLGRLYPRNAEATSRRLRTTPLPKSCRRCSRLRPEVEPDPAEMAGRCSAEELSCARTETAPGRQPHLGLSAPPTRGIIVGGAHNAECRRLASERLRYFMSGVRGNKAVPRDRHE
jgi:hypothetical protein